MNFANTGQQDASEFLTRKFWRYFVSEVIEDEDCVFRGCCKDGARYNCCWREMVHENAPNAIFASTRNLNPEWVEFGAKSNGPYFKAK